MAADMAAADIGRLLAAGSVEAWSVEAWSVEAWSVEAWSVEAWSVKAPERKSVSERAGINGQVEFGHFCSLSQRQRRGS